MNTIIPKKVARDERNVHINTAVVSKLKSVLDIKKYCKIPTGIAIINDIITIFLKRMLKSNFIFVFNILKKKKK